MAWSRDLNVRIFVAAMGREAWIGNRSVHDGSIRSAHRLRWLGLLKRISPRRFPSFAHEREAWICFTGNLSCCARPTIFARRRRCQCPAECRRDFFRKIFLRGLKKIRRGADNQIGHVVSTAEKGNLRGDPLDAKPRDSAAMAPKSQPGCLSGSARRELLVFMRRKPCEFPMNKSN